MHPCRVSKCLQMLSLKLFLGLRQGHSLVSIHHDTSSPSEATFVGCLYFSSRKALTWEEAKMICQVQISTLLAITSEEQMSFIKMELNVIADHDRTTHD